MDLKSLFLACAVVFPTLSCVTDEPAGDGPSGAVDIDTRDYPYIGYFAALRGAVHERWHYPADAVKRNLEGTAEIEFRILKNGRVDGVQVLKSTGHKVLDDAIVQAIKSAAPYLPLPEAFRSDSLLVRGSFRYDRSAYAPEPPGKGKRQRGPKKGLEIGS